ncbi:phosphoribosyltransferase [Qingshengfaniella alkalisoli]|uniref:Phosphoribosyltransferase n=1 Tax=Qingshengfaniella alkalisoli TaxID=2599296 RepID=A0A5B8IYU0_9RHOB|nr:phosphoribosyltransferase [Qingshengfaniella alkalisoli]QDY70743.1 phosphoribosyltransferase [Qingshengfaniella alkalisoli]
MEISPQDYWQHVYPDSLETGILNTSSFAASLPDDRRLLLPIRTLPGGQNKGVASLILNQASFEVLDTLADFVADQLYAHDPQVVIGVPTLGLPLAEAVARRLGHTRIVPLSTSRKFWYDPDLSQPLGSITSPDQAKTLYIDPRMMSLLDGTRVAVVDDVLSSGKSIASVLALLGKINLRPVAIGCAMLQSRRWENVVGNIPTVSAIATPLLQRSGKSWTEAEDQKTTG